MDLLTVAVIVATMLVGAAAGYWAGSKNAPQVQQMDPRLRAALVRRARQRVQQQQKPTPPPWSGPDEQYRVRRYTPNGDAAIQYKGRHGAQARDQYFDAIQRDDVVRVEFWDGDSLRSDWERGP